ncbi:MAG: ABC transporter substrate-binding protein [Proteobacteria bacterium]|nr:ABC transporter substrate-binding protein [Pseudomonadota bacterium]MDA1326002.1 ABC transporter substrate-binding protein [Pseudomonadota bacterium]
MTKRSDNKPGKTVTRRTIIKGGTSLGVMLAAGVAPSFIREAGASTLRKVDFMLPWLFVGGHTFEFAAQAEGWKKRGLDVSIQRGYGSGAAIKAVSSKTVNFAEASYGTAVNAVSKGLDVIAIGAKLQKNPMAVSCRKDSGIRSPKDLMGKSLVQAAASGDTLMFPGFVKAAGIDVTKIKRHMVHPSKLISSVLNKQADCTGTYYVSNAASLAHNTPSVHFMYADYGLQFLDLGLISRPDMIKNEPDLVQSMVDGAMEGLKLQLLDPEKALDYMIAARPELKTKPRDLLLTHSGNTNFLSISDAVEKHGLGWMDEGDQTRTRDVVIKYMNAKNVPPIGKLFTNRFAGTVKLTGAEWKQARAKSAKYNPKA